MDAPVVNADISHSVRVVMITPEGKILLVHQKKRIGPPRKGGRPGYPRPESYGIPGGTMEEKDGDFIGTAIREALGEARVIVPRAAVKEDYAMHFPPTPSDRDGAKETQTHYYFVLLTKEMETVVEIAESEKDEIIGQEFFRLEDFPLPEDKVPSFRTHVRNLRTLLFYLREKIEDADDWRYALEKRAAKYL